MSDDQIPKSLLPTGPINLAPVPPDVGDVSHKDVSSSLAKMEEAMAKFGLVKAGKQMMDLIYSLGVEAETVGVLKLSRGAAIVNHQALLNVLVKMSEAAEKASDDNLVAKLGYAIGYVSEKLSKVSKAMNDAEVEASGGQGANGKGSPMRRSFAPGTVVHAHNVVIASGTPR